MGVVGLTILGVTGCQSNPSASRWSLWGKKDQTAASSLAANSTAPPALPSAAAGTATAGPQVGYTAGGTASPYDQTASAAAYPNTSTPGVDSSNPYASTVSPGGGLAGSTAMTPQQGPYSASPTTPSGGSPAAPDYSQTAQNPYGGSAPQASIAYNSAMTNPYVAPTGDRPQYRTADLTNNPAYGGAKDSYPSGSRYDTPVGAPTENANAGQARGDYRYENPQKAMEQEPAGDGRFAGGSPSTVDPATSGGAAYGAPSANPYAGAPAGQMQQPMQNMQPQNGQQMAAPGQPYGQPTQNMAGGYPNYNQPAAQPTTPDPAANNYGLPPNSANAYMPADNGYSPPGTAPYQGANPVYQQPSQPATGMTPRKDPFYRPGGTRDYYPAGNGAGAATSSMPATGNVAQASYASTGNPGAAMPGAAIPSSTAQGGVSVGASASAGYGYPQTNAAPVYSGGSYGTSVPSSNPYGSGAAGY